MGKILDLSVFEEETLDVKLSDGKVIRLKKPTQALVIAMLRLRNMSENTPEEAALAAMNGITLKILNNNADGMTFEMSNVEHLSVDAKSALLFGYSEFAAQLQANPSCSSPQNPAPEKKPARRSCFGAFVKWWNTRA
jgi:hypothetical protein